ncbi:MAG TPA: helix-turn-helix domain-containing protein, partial [Candidatus Paceibacterota bacterium]|nr:helix-turn-helix domain-containing protein [Candidatus Paceibacterota bacterium]
YLALLSLESSTAYEIAQHCAVKKPTVYVILEELHQKGLVLKIPHAKKALFAAKDLSEYLAEQRGKLNTVQSMLPRLLAMGAVNKPKVYYFKGIRGLAEAMDYKINTMQGKVFYSFYGNLTQIDERARQLYTQWASAAEADGISFKKIGSEEQTGGPSPIIEIAETFVRICNMEHTTATIIDDLATAEAMRHIFNISWAKGV